MPPSLRRRGGGNAIEFALLLPLWVLIIAATMDFGWIFYHQAVLDAAANMGCRSGSLLDPGDLDESLEMVEEATTARMTAVLTSFGGFEDPDDFILSVSTTGVPPSRSLLCEVSTEVEPLTGLVTTTRTLRANQVARLEWQREAAP
ncbi:MAG: TadE family protein [Pseudomonadota bacterium]